MEKQRFISQVLWVLGALSLVGYLGKQAYDEAVFEKRCNECSMRFGAGYAGAAELRPEIAQVRVPDADTYRRAFADFSASEISTCDNSLFCLALAACSDIVHWRDDERHRRSKQEYEEFLSMAKSMRKK